MDDLATKLDGFEAVMTRILDKLTGLEAWRSTTDALMEKLLNQADTTAVRITGVSNPRGEGVNRVANRFLS